MPQYNLGHLDRVATIRRHLAKYSQLYLAGVAYDGVGIPDCIHAAEMTAAAIKHATVSLYDDCGHSPFYEDAERYNRELAAFVTTVWRGSGR